MEVMLMFSLQYDIDELLNLQRLFLSHNLIQR